ncbi:hypothetical protein KM295_15095 [Natronomonas sp. F2-12]|uniref:Uncharacterized protein n=1 Tax=Natronomonas aquatica TaxID=2841590 RepID=A0A9R1CWB3_9EURY|nr:hypothetical protein [Natronomonas aquatica]MCQ4334779.1 hypothetical protein [Natronomonas aquatica]
MKTVGEEVYELPIFEDQLVEFTYSPTEDYTDWDRVDPETHDGEVHIKETIFDSPEKAIHVIHRVKNKDKARYRFNIIDRDRRICRYTGEDTPPWSIFCAVTKYGYHCETAPEPNRKHIFGLLFAAGTELTQHVQDEKYEYFSGVGSLVSQILLFYSQIAAVEEQVGPDRMEEFVSVLPESDSHGPVEFKAIETALTKMGIENSYIPTSLFHPSVDSLLDSHMRDSESKEDPDSSEEGSTSSRNLSYVIQTNRGHGEHQNKMYVSLIGADAIDRFSFEFTDEDESECVAQTGVEGDLPPYMVIDSVREEYNIKNISSFVYDEDIPLIDILLDIDQLVRRTTSHFPPESFATKNLLSEYLYAIDVCLAVAVAYESAPAQYNYAIEQVFSKLGVPLTVQNVIKTGHAQRNKISAVAFQAIDDIEETNMEKIQKRGRGLHNITRIEDRWSKNDNNEIETPLLKRIYNPDVSLQVE